MSETEKHVVLKGVAGLGNRILALLTACLYARLAGRTLYVDWREGVYAEPGDNAFPHLFTSPCCRPYPPDLPRGTVWPTAWTDRLDAAVKDIRMAPPYRAHPTAWDVLSADHSRLDYAEDTVVLWSYFENVRSLRRYFRGPYDHLRGLRTRAVLRTVHDECLRPAPDIEARIDAFRRAHMAGPVIGVHVRASDKRSRTRPIHRHLGRMLRRNPGARVFLATDNRLVLRDFQSRYGDVLSTDKWYPPPGAAMHTSAQRPDRVAGGREALVDLYLLAGCDHLVADESSAFAYVASVLFDGSPGGVRNVQRGRRIPPAVRRWLWTRWRAWSWDRGGGGSRLRRPSR